MLPQGTTFQETVEPYLRACPGPALAKAGLRLVAYQRIPGIPGLEVPSESTATSIPGVAGRGGTYLRSLADVATRVHCRSRYLSDAVRRGYSYSRALRWLRFLHGLVLRDTARSTWSMVRSLGFSDPSGWTRFTKALIGKTPRQIPMAPMDFWVRLAIEDVYLNGGIRLGGGSTGQQDMRNDK